MGNETQVRLKQLPESSLSNSKWKSTNRPSSIEYANGFSANQQPTVDEYKSQKITQDESLTNVLVPNELVVSDRSPSQATQGTHLKKESALNFLKDKVIRIVLLTGDQKTTQTTVLLDEVDAAMKKSKLFTMTQV